MFRRFVAFGRGRPGIGPSGRSVLRRRGRGLAGVHVRAGAGSPDAWRKAGFSTTGTVKPARKTLWRIESISRCGGSLSGLREIRPSAQAAKPRMNAASARAVSGGAVMLQEVAAPRLVPVGGASDRRPVAASARSSPPPGGRPGSRGRTRSPSRPGRRAGRCPGRRSRCSKPSSSSPTCSSTVRRRIRLAAGDPAGADGAVRLGRGPGPTATAASRRSPAAGRGPARSRSPGSGTAWPRPIAVGRDEHAAGDAGPGVGVHER